MSGRNASTRMADSACMKRKRDVTIERSPAGFCQLTTIS